MSRYQMLWDCPSCDSKKLLGLDHRHCPSCGAAQDPERRYFPAQGEEIAVEDHPFVGADLRCPACDSPNAARSEHCVNCGSPLDAAKAVLRRADQAAGAIDDSKAAHRELTAQKQAAKAAARGEAPVVPPKKSASKKLFVIGAVLLAMFAGCIVLLTWSKPVEVEAKSHKWSRTIDVEEMRSTSASDWKGSVPSGAYAVRCTREQRSTKKIENGRDCTEKRKDLGDGTFKKVMDCKPKYREEPVYDDKCSYQIDRWVVARTLKAEGASSSDAPRWPDLPNLRRGSSLGSEREGKRAEAYEVVFEDSATHKSHACAFPMQKWAAIAVGAKLHGEKGALAGDLRCDGLH